ncbi:response regulator [Methylobacterium soli]|uniref:Regulatory protein VirG n=1 Tax=Methylobacterium soli TaxID=553447 RepID=A0A6L3SQ47_9HYPH|nr:response regulator [Methylobacterium soli]KAB1072927.1 response regulator [Methylobacterium soli]GJE42773.1 Transcriptional regulatory protein OmpR [Methylobacterium soli]
MNETALAREHAGRASDLPIRVLVVDDDPAMRDLLHHYLGEHDVQVQTASNRQEMASRLRVGEPHLVILDLRLGSDDGLALLREIRARSELPVIITTGHRRDEIDRVIGLELGADDYLTKPFSPRELLARIRTVLRRQDAWRAAQRDAGNFATYHFEGWQLSTRTRRLTDPEGSNIPLTKGEYALLLAFVSAPQRPLTREHLLQATRVHEDVFDRSIDVQILRLRRKLEADPSQPRFILTERGVGYVFAPVVQVG